MDGRSVVGPQATPGWRPGGVVAAPKAADQLMSGGRLQRGFDDGSGDEVIDRVQVFVDVLDGVAARWCPAKVRDGGAPPGTPETALVEDRDLHGAGCGEAGVAEWRGDKGTGARRDELVPVPYLVLDRAGEIGDYLR